jgi:serine protease AprX
VPVADNKLTKSIGEHWTCAELARRGWSPALTRDGSADVSQIIAGLDWVTQHPNLPDGSRVRVVNLAFGTDSVQPYLVDPLAAAAENAWKHGLVVIVSGGNEGAGAWHLTDPAMDPYVIAVGASDSDESVAGWGHPDVADYSSSGSWMRHVDLLAPGSSIASLRDPGSFVDVNHPEGLVAGDTTGRLFRGSGTSQAAAVVSGAVALLLQANPDLTPDQVKYALTQTAKPMPDSAVSAGAGELDVKAAVAAVHGSALFDKAAKTGGVAQGWFPSTGQGSIEAARGGDHLLDTDGNVISGEVDVQGNPWRPGQWWNATRAGSAWSDGAWNGATWTGTKWAGNGNWDSARWDSARWDSARWDSARWDSARWDSARWDSARWDSARWDAAYWDSARWDSARWDASTWN